MLVLSEGIIVPFLVVEKNNKLPRYIFLIWQDNIVRIICMFKKRKLTKKKSNEKNKYVALYNGSHSMVSPRSLLRMSTLAKTGGCTYLFLFFFFKISSAAILYAVQQANVGLFCSVLLSFHMSHPNTFQHL